MSNFDLDNYLFGDLTEKKVEEKIIPPQSEKPKVEEAHQKMEEFEKIHPKKLGVFEQKSHSDSLVLDKQEKENSAEIPEDIEMGQNYEDDLPDWGATQSSEPSREDIIKGINFSSRDIKESLKPYDYSQQDKNAYSENNVDDSTKAEFVREEIYEEKKEPKQNLKIKDDSLSTPRVKPEDEDTDPTPTTPPPKTPKIQETKRPNSPEKQEGSKTNKGFFLKIFVYVLLFIILCLLLIFAYLNRSSLSQLANNIDTIENNDMVEENDSEVIGEREYIIQAKDNIQIRNELDVAINNILTNDYKILTTGGFALVYNEMEEGIEAVKEVEMTFGNGENHAHFQNGLLTYINLNEDLLIAWDTEHKKYIISEDNEEYTIVTDDSDEYHKNFLGQHVLQDLIYEYLKNKSNFVELGPQAWTWDWSFYTPINDYKTKNILNTVVIVDEETGLIEEIKLYDSDKKIGEYAFEFKELQKKDYFDIDIIEKYTFTEESKFK